MPNTLHDNVFTFCEAYGFSHPCLHYGLGEPNADGKLNADGFFQANEKYAFVYLYDANGVLKRTRSIFLLFTLNDKNV